MGGFNAPFPSPAVSSFYEYDINADSWTQFFAGAEGFEDSLIYIIGGMQDNVTDADLLRVNVVFYNTLNNVFTEATPMPEGTASMGHSLVDRSLYISAGLTGTTGNFVPNNITLKGKIDISNRFQINWEYKTDRPLAVYAHYDYIESEDEIYSAGGSISGGFSPSPAAFGYSISTNAYEDEPDLPNPLMAFYGGVTPPKNSNVFRVAISGGITTGPALTNETWFLTEIVQGINIDGGTVPVEYSLMQNYPNPFNPSTNIEYSIPSESFVELKVYDVLGSEVITLVNEQQRAGVYRANFTADNLPSGMYFARLTANEFTQVVKMILLK